jgi:glycosyltransferase involved in cell wall biosynthesis
VNIVMLSDHESQGGAAQSACRLAEALCCYHQVTRVVLIPDGKPHPWRTEVLGPESRWATWLNHAPRKLWPGRFPWPHTPRHVGMRLRRLLMQLRPDVINLHNLHGGTAWGWSAQLAAVCAEVAPVVWTLHDMWSFTGRCAYSYDCERFRTGCNASCPTPDEPPALSPDCIATAWDERRRLFDSHPGLTAVTPSRWLADEARRGLWGRHRVEVIPYGVPTDVFRPMPRAEARRRLQVPVNAPVLLVAAHDLTERRKGAGLLADLWKRIRVRPMTVLTMGHGTVNIDEHGISVYPLGWLAGDAAKAVAYNAADALLHAAPVDNFPNVLLEAIACGTPAIGLPVGGVPELIRPGTSGWLASRPTAEALAVAAEQALAAIADGLELRGSCRALARNEYALPLQGSRYDGLFDVVGVRTGRKKSWPRWLLSCRPSA